MPSKRQGQKQGNVRMVGGNKQIFRMDIDWELHLHGWVF